MNHEELLRHLAFSEKDVFVREHATGDIGSIETVLYGGRLFLVAFQRAAHRPTTRQLAFEEFEVIES